MTAASALLHGTDDRRQVQAAFQLLAMAADVLADADGEGPETASIVREARREASGVAARVAELRRTEDAEGIRSALAATVYAARDLARLSDRLADQHRPARPAALACTTLAETAARLAIEALTEELAWSDVELVARRARQRVDLASASCRLQAMVDLLDDSADRWSARAGVDGPLRGR
jgi:hypothetical protein